MGLLGGVDVVEPGDFDTRDTVVVCAGLGLEEGGVFFFFFFW